MSPTEERLVVLGSTGSIGTQTLDVVERLRQQGRPFRVAALSAGRNLEALVEQIRRHRPERVFVSSEPDAVHLRALFPDIVVHHGSGGLEALVRDADADTVVNGLVGAVGLPPTLAALDRGCTVALANKESLVIGGELVMSALSSGPGRLVPVDSEHNAIFQCLLAGRREDVRRLILTASGGPFRTLDAAALGVVTPADALAHPTWSMGPRITIDSATMVNKAFEVIEAHFLFGLPYDRIDVVLHCESIVHSKVEFVDGSIVAEMASHDMRIPIQYALTYPQRAATGLPRLDLSEPLTLHLEPMDEERYPAFPVVLEAGRLAGSAPAAVNAADEVLVSRFLGGGIRFTEIAQGLRWILDRWKAEMQTDDGRITLDRLLAVDCWARRLAAEPMPGAEPRAAKERG